MSDGSLMSGVVARQQYADQSYDGSEHTSAKYLWLFAVIVQLVLAARALDFIFFDEFSTFGLQILTYSSISVWAFFVFKDKGIIGMHDMQKLVKYLIMSGLYVAVPAYMYFVPDYSIGQVSLESILTWIFYVIYPTWPIYIAKHSGDHQIMKWQSWYVNTLIFLMLIILIFYYASELRTSDLPGARPEVLQARSVLDFFIDKAATGTKNIFNSLNPDKLVNVIVNATGINYYTGVVDQNENQPVGLYIDNVRLQDRYTYVGSPAVVWADIRGKSFTEKEIRVTPVCYIEASGNKRTDGTPNPTAISLFGSESDSLRCTFNDLAKGSYRATVAASFNFETWAYVTYTFVDIGLARAMDVEGKNINSELDIPRLPRAIYTNGPVFLGMGSMVDQPVRIDLQENSRNPVVGVTLEDRWSDGDLERVNEFRLIVPDDFELINCDRWLPDTTREPTESEDGYDVYTFAREELADPRVQFSSVTCQVHIKEPTQFMAGQQKVQRTFAAQVNYDYQIRKTTSLTVRE